VRGSYSPIYTTHEDGSITARSRARSWHSCCHLTRGTQRIPGGLRGPAEPPCWQSTNCAGSNQIVGQVQATERGSAPKKCPESCDLGQPCETHLQVRTAIDLVEAHGLRQVELSQSAYFDWLQQYTRCPPPPPPPRRASARARPTRPRTDAATAEVNTHKEPSMPYGWSRVRWRGRAAAS
jgi:hypothetical protein